MTTLRSGSATHVGQVRSLNEDSFLVLADADLYGVADGMGGHNGGEIASAMAVEFLQEHAGDPTLENLKQAARLGNRAIFEKAGNDAELHGMGTTLCAVRVVPGPEGDEIAWINVGDSRVYLFRDNDLLQLSRDHSLVEDLLRDGQLTEDEAKVHPKRNIITRALGIDVDVDVDGATVIPFNGDRFLLCSDGLFGEVSDDQISSVLRRLADPTEAADELVRLANESGGRDNITVVIVEVTDDDGRSLAAAEALAAEQARIKAREAAEKPVEWVDPDEPATQPLDEDHQQALAGRRSSLPDGAADFASESDDLFGELEGARARRFTWRVVMFVVAILAVVAVALIAILWSSRKDYVVATDKAGNVVVYRGDPDGFLLWDAPVDNATGIKASTLTKAQQAELRKGKTFDSSFKAASYVLSLTQSTTTTTTTTTTSTTTSTSTTSTTPKATTTTPKAPTTTSGP